MLTMYVRTYDYGYIHAQPVEMQQYIDISPYHDTLSQWYSIDTNYVVLIYQISGYIEYRAWYVTGPARMGHICTQNLALFLNFNLQYLFKYKYRDN